MSSLLDRLMGINIDFDDPTTSKIPIHAFMAALSEAKRNPFSQTPIARLNAIAAAFNLTVEQTTQLAEFGTTFVTGSDYDRHELHDVLLLSESGFYSKSQVKTRLNLLND